MSTLKLRHRLLRRAMHFVAAPHVRLYRATGGRVVDRFTGGAPGVLLTTRGRKSGQRRTIPVGHLHDGDDLLVVGTYGGMPYEPSWLLNLRADPRAEVHHRSDRWPVTAIFPDDDEWDNLWKRFVDASRSYDWAPSPGRARHPRRPTSAPQSCVDRSRGTRMISNNRLYRLASLTGIAVVILWLAGIILVGASAYFPTAEEALAIVSEAPGRVQAGALLAGFYGGALLIAFSGALHAALRQREAGNGSLATIAFGGGLLCALALAVGYGMLWFAAGRASRPGGITAEEAAVLYSVYEVFLASVLSIGLAALIGATGLVVLLTQLFPAWLGWLSLVFALGLLTPLHWLFIGLATLWIVAVSVLLYRRTETSGAA